MIGKLNVTTTDCGLFQRHPETNVTILPCGAVANSLFNDTISLKFVSGEGETGFDEVKLLRTGIAWEYDKEINFFNPMGLDEGEFMREFFINL